MSENPSDNVSGHKGLKRLLAAVGLLGTAASVWWFALKPRRQRRKQIEP